MFEGVVLCIIAFWSSSSYGNSDSKNTSPYIGAERYDLSGRDAVIRLARHVLRRGTGRGV